MGLEGGRQELEGGRQELEGGRGKVGGGTVNNRQPTPNAQVRAGYSLDRGRGLWVVGCWALALALPAVWAADTGDWEVVKSRHFLVMHTGDAPFAERAARVAETHYHAIAEDLGYSRTSGFWTWDNRVRIMIHPTAESFRAAFQAPGWAAGGASIQRHEIAGCRPDGEGFLSTILPHEMAHLVLSDFVGARQVPGWLAEGFAQWEQDGRKSSRMLLGRDPGYALRDLMSMDIRQERDTARVHLYYAQCASLVGFLIGSGGGDRFGRFCRLLRDGKPCVEALASAYPDLAATVEDLERAWRKSLKDAAR
jgi:hypothetical protein